MRRLALLLLAAASLAPAYYHFVRYSTRTAPFTPIYDRFDLNALPNKTVPFLISESGPSQFAAGDTFASVISQIRAAARVWNGVETAELKLAFGGLHTPSATMNSPWIEVEFTDELPPGVLAQGGPITRLDPVTSPYPFVPIAKSLLRLPRNLSTRASFSERFFLTVVHEFGHTLGLQHSWTSGVMSTEITRATSKATPLTADDAAALSVLYPTTKFASQTGAISGRVTSAGVGVALASVVAFAPNRPAVSALTHPDGAYRIEGLPPGQYFIAAHPLPPSVTGEPQPVNLELPSDSAGRILPGAAFDTQFYPGSATPQNVVTVSAGQAAENIDFAVNRRDKVNLYGVQTYSFLGQEAIKPATFNISQPSASIILTGYGVTAPLPGLSINLVSAPERIIPGGIKSYSSGYLQVDVGLNPLSSEGPRHLLFQYNGETYFHPSGLSMVQRPAPSLLSVTANADRTLTLTGASLSASTQIWFDGAAAKVRANADGSLTVTPPPAPASYRAVLAALNPDGQSSLFVHGANSPAFTYDASTEAPRLSINPAALPAGTESIVEISATGADLTAWNPSLGFGSSDIAVRQIWPISADRALAWVAISPWATPGPTTLTTAAGLALSSTAAGFQVLPNSRPNYVAMSSLVKTPTYPGTLVTLPVANTQPAMTMANFSVLIGDRQAQVASFSNGNLTVQVPAGLASGPALVRVFVDGVSALPAVLVIDPPPPIILFAQNTLSGAVTAANAPRPGDTIQIVVSSLVEGSPASIDITRVKVTTGAVEHSVQSVTSNAAQPGTYIVQFSLSTSSPAQTSLPITVSIDDRVSSAFILPFRP